MSDVALFFFSSRRRHTRYWRDWSSDVCSSDLYQLLALSVGGMRDGAGGRRGAGHVDAASRRALPRHGDDLVSTDRDAGDDQQIGRASCRERVKISVVAGIIKKKRILLNIRNTR